MRKTSAILTLALLVGCGQQDIAFEHQGLVVCPATPTLTLTPNQFTVREQRQLEWRFTPQMRLRGNGVPPVPIGTTIDDTPLGDLAVAQLELPLGAGGDDEHGPSIGVHTFAGPRFCQLGSPCNPVNGLFRAWVIRAGGQVDEVQVRLAAADTYSALDRGTYRQAVGVFLQANDAIECGDQLLIAYQGEVIGRSSIYNSSTFQAHFRYRPSAPPPGQGTSCNPGGNWLPVLDTPMTVNPGVPATLRVIAPLDVALREQVPVALVLTDRYGNPVDVATGLPEIPTIVINGRPLGPCVRNPTHPFRCELTVPIPPATPANRAYKVTATLLSYPNFFRTTMRIVPQYVYLHATGPTYRRQLGDVHTHSGDGGAQIKFLGASPPGDHAGLFTRTIDTLFYMERVAGLDFGAVSEHSVRGCDYAPPLRMREHCAFVPGAANCDVGRLADGVCAPGVHALLGNRITCPPQPTPGLRSTWYEQQFEHVYEYQEGLAPNAAFHAGPRFTAFQAYEWHGPRTSGACGSVSELDMRLHRVVLFRDLVDPGVPGSLPPLLPGDLNNVPPQCLDRFLDLNGWTGDRATVIPHMMVPADGNTDWDATYPDLATAEGRVLDAVAPRSLVDSFTRVGEIYSARARDRQGLFPDGYDAQLTSFEESTRPGDQGLWTYRYGWQARGAEIGVIGSSDNHSQFAGVNDDMPLFAGQLNRDEPVRANEPGGYAVALAAGGDLRPSIYSALRARRTYATTGVRAYLDFTINGDPMGTGRVVRRATAMASLRVYSGVPIRRLELWEAEIRAGAGYNLLHSVDGAALPNPEVFEAQNVMIPKPTVAGGRYLYFGRVFFREPDSSNLESDEAAWTSPIWIDWR